MSEEGSITALEVMDNRRYKTHLGYTIIGKGKGNAISLQALTGPYGCRRLRLPEFIESRHMLVVNL
jgi:hypothetical protein